MFNENKLRGKMAEKRYSVNDLAKALGINYSTFYRKSIGKSEFTRSEIQRIADILHLSIQDIQDIFFTGELA